MTLHLMPTDNTRCSACTADAGHGLVFLMVGGKARRFCPTCAGKVTPDPVSPEARELYAKLIRPSPKSEHLADKTKENA